MVRITRRQLTAASLLSALPVRAASLDEALRATVQRHGIPQAVAMVATAEKTLYSGAVGPGSAADSIFSIASMTKAITSAAAMQLVERGKIALDEPAGRHLPELAKLNVLHGFEKESGKPILRPASKPVTLRHLLSHTSGFAYDMWHEGMFRYNTRAGSQTETGPLVFEPGEGWQYGTSTDWAGRLVEAVSGQDLERYFQQNILGPLGMTDTSYILPPAKFSRLVRMYERRADGSLKENPRTQPQPPKSFNGGGGLYSTVGDYTRFMQSILRPGKVLQAKSVEAMGSNQIGALSAGKMKTFRPDRSSDVLFHPGATDGFGLGFLINAQAYEGGRSAGSLAWAGIFNTFYWIDPRRQICAVLMMQFLPFVDKDAMGVLGDFERAVYAAG